MRSIQFHLTLWLAVVLMALSAVSGGSLLVWIRHSMLHEFDRSLLANARAFQSLVTQTASGRLDVDVNVQALSDFTGRSATDYFSFEDAQGHTVAASNPERLAGHPWNETQVASAWNTHLPNGADARAIRVEFQPTRTSERDDSDEEDHAGSAAQAGPFTLRLTVARDRRPLDAMMLGVTIAVGAATLLFSAAAVLAATIVVRRGLASLRELATEVADVDVNAASHPFDASRRPRELAPIVRGLNELLGRVGVALRRERQFTAAVSHELRTPIAELRSAAEIAMREPDDRALARRAVVQAQEIAVQMHTMVSTLLSISAADRSAETIQSSDVEIGRVVRRSVERRGDALARRRVTVEDRIADDAVAWSNDALLAAIVENLLGNACQYAREGTAIVIDCVAESDRIALSFENEQNTLSAEDLPHLFEPFWRKEAARSQSEHVGLGLALVRAYARTISATVDATLTPAGRFRICVWLPAARSNDSAKSEMAVAHA